MVRVGKSTHPAGGEIRKWKYCSAYSMKVKVWHITWKRKFGILQACRTSPLPLVLVCCLQCWGRSSLPLCKQDRPLPKGKHSPLQYVQSGVDIMTSQNQLLHWLTHSKMITLAQGNVLQFLHFFLPSCAFIPAEKASAISSWLRNPSLPRARPLKPAWNLKQEWYSSTKSCQCVRRQ